MKKKLLIGVLSIIPASMLIYWFNLDNKLLYYGVRPILNKVYNSQHRDVTPTGSLWRACLTRWGYRVM